MTNNDIFKKLRVALMLRDDQIVEILELVDFRISKSELGAFFRDEKHEDRKSTRLNSSHSDRSRMPSSA